MLRYTRVIKQTNSYNPNMAGSHYDYTATNMSEHEVLHPDAHVFFNHGAVQNEQDMNAVIMNHISIKAGLKKWDKKGR